MPGPRLTRSRPADGPDRITLHTAADEAAEAASCVGTVDELVGGSDLTSFLRGTADTWTDAVHSFADIAVLYRTDAQARALVDALEPAGVPVQKRSHDRLGDQPGVRELLGVLRADLPGRSAAGRPAPGAGPGARGGAGGIDRAGGLPAARRRHRRRRLVPAGAGHRPGGAGRRGRCDDREPDPALLVAQLRAAVELLSPLAERAGEDADRFLAELATGAEVDVWDPRADRVTLLTLHAAKGLEFPVVFLVGCEDGLLPLRFGPAGRRGGRPDDADVAEERRLFFVGMTRARTHLLLSHARRRTSARARSREPRAVAVPGRPPGRAARADRPRRAPPHRPAAADLNRH